MLYICCDGENLSNELRSDKKRLIHQIGVLFSEWDHLDFPIPPVLVLSGIFFLLKKVFFQKRPTIMGKNCWQKIL